VAGQPKAVLRLGVIKELKDGRRQAVFLQRLQGQLGEKPGRAGMSGIRLGDDRVSGRDRRGKIPAGRRVEGKRKIVGAENDNRAASGPCLERRLFLVSIVARHQERSRQAAAAWRN